MATGGVPLRELPAVAEQVAVGVVRAAHALATSAIDHSRDDSSPSRAQLLVRKAQLDWRMSLAKKEGRVFLFFRSEGMPQTQLEATVRLMIEASDSFGEIVPLAEERPAILLRAVPPSFLELSPSPEELERFAPGVTAGHTTLLHLGTPDSNEVLAITTEAGGENPRFHVTTPTGGGWINPDPGRLPVMPFASAFEVLRAWVAAGAPVRDEARSVVLAAQAPTDLGGILSSLADACAAASLALESGEPLTHLPEWMITRYRVSSYSAVVLLWLDDDGSLADEPGEAALSLAHHMTVRRMASALEGWISLAPADFLADGPLLAGISRAMQEAVEGSREQVFGPAPPSAEVLGSFFVGAHAASLRVTREKKDERHVVLWRGAVDGRVHWLVAAAWVVVKGDASEGWEVSLSDDGQLEVQAFGPASDELFGLRPEVAEFLVKYVNNLRRWEQLLS